MILDTGVFLDLDTVDRDDLDLAALRAALPVWRFHKHTGSDGTATRLAGAQVAVTNKAVIGERELVEAPGLRLICVAATGYNNIDTGAARRRGVAVCNVSGYSTPSVVQHVFASILALATGLPQYAADVRAGRWQTSSMFCRLDHPIREIAGCTLGIVGYGTLGRAVADVARVFGMLILVARSLAGGDNEGRVPLDALLAESDIVSLHCPLTDQTRGLIGAAEFARMKPGAFLVNTARGGIVDELALADALRRGAIAGAAVDVLSQEPPPADHPLLAPDIPNLIVTPHVAWASRESRQRLVDEIAANIRAFLRGEKRNRIV